jgi:hypothetical protein
MKPSRSAQVDSRHDFRSEEDERDFWAKNDSTAFIDWQTAQRRRLPNLKPNGKNASA